MFVQFREVFFPLPPPRGCALNKHRGLLESNLACVMRVPARPPLWCPSPAIISTIPCSTPATCRPADFGPSQSPLSFFFWVSGLVGQPVRCAFRSRRHSSSCCICGSCLPNAVSSELLLPLPPEQAKSKHSTLWLKGHLSRGGNPAPSFPKSINRGGLLSRGTAHCHGNAPI